MEDQVKDKEQRPMPSDDIPDENDLPEFDLIKDEQSASKHRPPSLWRFEILQRGDENHAADAIEIVAGDIVRRVSLTAIDYSVIHQRNIWVTSLDNNIDERGAVKTEPGAADLAPLCDLDEETIHAALRRLAVVGLLPFPGEGKPIQ